MNWKREEPVVNATTMKHGSIESDMGYIIFNSDGFNVLRTSLTPEAFIGLREAVFEFIKERQEFYEK